MPLLHFPRQLPEPTETTGPPPPVSVPLASIVETSVPTTVVAPTSLIFDSARGPTPTASRSDPAEFTPPQHHNAHKKHGIPPALIAAIIVFALLVIFFVFFFVRKWKKITKRNRHRSEEFTSRSSAFHSQSYEKSVDGMWEMGRTDMTRSGSWAMQAKTPESVVPELGYTAGHHELATISPGAGDQTFPASSRPRMDVITVPPAALTPTRPPPPSSDLHASSLFLAPSPDHLAPSSSTSPSRSTTPTISSYYAGIDSSDVPADAMPNPFVDPVLPPPPAVRNKNSQMIALNDLIAALDAQDQQLGVLHEGAEEEDRRTPSPSVRVQPSDDISLRGYGVPYPH
ncbi:hypothetical protein BOTBODRAFT_59202 [Botryobasidium botryosum FD-172 SS1]|uniref:Uncharacterized protein n=1 Tax=Botryobasidium botryosum (strain FD-172 SS1) TaxID=930990 RepID=A0A067MAV4_BOTB1|nr:hypothetical protein BOTBODRAFT_59202 [Botryobasidium botryosum FD-172 SS1]